MTTFTNTDIQDFITITKTLESFEFGDIFTNSETFYSLDPTEDVIGYNRMYIKKIQDAGSTFYLPYLHIEDDLYVFLPKHHTVFGAVGELYFSHVRDMVNEKIDDLTRKTKIKQLPYSAEEFSTIKENLKSAGYRVVKMIE